MAKLLAKEWSGYIANMLADCQSFSATLERDVHFGGTAAEGYVIVNVSGPVTVTLRVIPKPSKGPKKRKTTKQK